MAVSRVIDRVGQVLGGRYRLLALIGTGASASVYLADDRVLRRRVAIKILHEALAGDESFLKRFRAEARAAAALNHPNIMAVYDWGQDPEMPYLIMEYLAGGSLRSLLDQSGPLTPAQGLLVGLEAARGLEYAHRRGFVHRDIKPANLLFDDESRLRIGDFGLARALAEAAWTEPMGAVLGTAKYASPEQARGETLDGKSDVYSLALVLVEAITGKVPFASDTSLGTLMARVNKIMPVPESCGALQSILQWAGQPDPARRPDAAEFGAALMGAASSFDRPAPLALAGAHLPDNVVVDLDPTEPGGGRSAAAARASVVAAAAVDPGPDDDIDPGPDDDASDPTWADGDAAGEDELSDAGAHLDPDGVSPSDGQDPLDDGEPILLDEPDDEALVGEPIRQVAGSGRRWWNMLPLTASPDPDLDGDDLDAVAYDTGAAGRPDAVRTGAAAAAAAAGATAVATRPPSGSRTASTPAPGGSVLYRDDPTVEADLGLASVDDTGRDAGWDAEPGGYDDGERWGRYDRRTAPVRRRRRRRIWPRVLFVLVVVAGLVAGGTAYWYYDVRIPTYPVPAVVGRNYAELESMVSGFEWTISHRNDRYDDVEPAGKILEQNPAPNTELARGGTLAVVVSKGPPPVPVPVDLVGKPLPDATAALEAIGLHVGDVTREFSEDVPADVVIALAPSTPGTVLKGQDVALVVSKGPEPRTIPDGLVGQPVDQVAVALKRLDLDVDTTEDFSETVAKGNVISLSPPSGQQVPKGATVQLVVSKGPPTVPVPDVAGMSVTDAVKAIEGAGLTVSGTDGSPTKKVKGTDPEKGTVVKKGSSVRIITETDEPTGTDPATTTTTSKRK